MRGRNATGRAAVYTRFSTDDQHSTEDQVRTCREWAARNGLIVEDRHVFSDEGKTGRSTKRAGLDALRAALAAKEVDALIVFSTNRLFRRMYHALQFVAEQVVERGLRCVFVTSHIDTADGHHWESLLMVNGFADQMLITASKEHIRAAHQSQLLSGRVFGTLPFGYTGTEIVGQQNRKGRPARQIAVDPEQAEWVRKIFDWFTRERLSINATVNRLNECRAPLPPRAVKKRWTRISVRRLLGNERYVGTWSYGKYESVWQSQADYTRQIQRDEPLRTVQREDLRIVDDVAFHQAQALLHNFRARTGRRSEHDQRLNRVLSGLLFCPKHKHGLRVAGANGGWFACQSCAEESDPALFSFVHSSWALKRLCETLVQHIEADAELVESVIDRAREICANRQEPDPIALDELLQRKDRLGRKIALLMDELGDSEEDVAESKRQLRQWRAERMTVEAELMKLRQQAVQRVRLPTREEVATAARGLSDVLKSAGASPAPEDQAALRDVIELLTGGVITVEQRGERKRQRGWLAGRFDLRLIHAIGERIGIAGLSRGGRSVEVDFRRPTMAEAVADQVRALYRDGLSVKEICGKLDISKSLVERAHKIAYERTGEAKPDGRAMRSRPGATRPRKKCEQIAETVMALFDQGIPYADIALRLGIDRGLVTAAVRFGHGQRGLTAPDGRTRRRQVRSARRAEQEARTA